MQQSIFMAQIWIKIVIDSLSYVAFKLPDIPTTHLHKLLKTSNICLMKLRNLDDFFGAKLRGRMIVCCISNKCPKSCPIKIKLIFGCIPINTRQAKRPKTLFSAKTYFLVVEISSNHQEKSQFDWLGYKFTNL